MIPNICNSEYTFPFEGNWNTFISDSSSRSATNILWIHFPVWRELKLMTDKPHQSDSVRSEYTFPFEGNWNNSSIAKSAISVSDLWIHFPVWRELKHEGLNNKEIATLLWIHFPVWRELKQFRRQISQNRISRLWIHFPVWRELKRLGRRWNHRRHTPLNTLSRLKGIETSTDSPEGISTVMLWIHFPVWRELKLEFQASTWRMRNPVLWIHFPVWRELKLSSFDY